LKRNTLVLIAVLFILVLFAGTGWLHSRHRRQAAETPFVFDAGPGDAVLSAPSPQASPLKGQVAPDFALKDLSGRRVSLASYKGKAVLINFWATWCAPCKIETPWLIELREKYAAQGFEVLGVSTEGDDLKMDDKAGWARDKAAVGKFVQRMKVPYPVLMGGDSISREYGGLDVMPASFYVDRKGTVVASQVGGASKSEIEANIRKALGE
jgi:cytochrome c biogenesis protein CcmG/thiol:disulfide interchange protein DsbE